MLHFTGIYQGKPDNGNESNLNSFTLTEWDF